MSWEAAARAHEQGDPPITHRCLCNLGPCGRPTVLMPACPLRAALTVAYSALNSSEAQAGACTKPTLEATKQTFTLGVRSNQDKPCSTAMGLCVVKFLSFSFANLPLCSCGCPAVGQSATGSAAYRGPDSCHAV